MVKVVLRAARRPRRSTLRTRRCRYKYTDTSSSSKHRVDHRFNLIVILSVSRHVFDVLNFIFVMPYLRGRNGVCRIVSYWHWFQLLIKIYDEHHPSKWGSINNLNSDSLHHSPVRDQKRRVDHLSLSFCRGTDSRSQNVNEVVSQSFGSSWYYYCSNTSSVWISRKS